MWQVRGYKWGVALGNAGGEGGGGLYMIFAVEYKYLLKGVVSRESSIYYKVYHSEPSLLVGAHTQKKVLILDCRPCKMRVRLCL